MIYRPPKVSWKRILNIAEDPLVIELYTYRNIQDTIFMTKEEASKFNMDLAEFLALEWAVKDVLKTFNGIDIKARRRIYKDAVKHLIDRCRCLLDNLLKTMDTLNYPKPNTLWTKLP